MHNAKALNPDAEEAIPLLCGNELEVSILNLYVLIKEAYSLIRSKNVFIFGSKPSSLFPST